VAQDTWSGSPASIMTTTFRPDAADPSIVAYATWIRTPSTQLALYPGYEGPGPTTLDRGPEMVPVTARQTLLATFNSGFYEKDAPAGFYVNNTLYFPMINGLATVVEHTDGSVDIVDWEGGPSPGPNVVMARQNLSLLVANQAATPETAVGGDWGITLGGVPAVWRTGLGIDDRGNLLYVAAPNQTAATLAQILVKLGAVRAMQLDINPEWPIFVTYGGPGAVGPALFVPNPNQIPNRFLYSSTKDFFAVYQRPPVMTPQPW
jgi:Phosphodiester glycosidase